VVDEAAALHRPPIMQSLRSLKRNTCSST